MYRFSRFNYSPRDSWFHSREFRYKTPRYPRKFIPIPPPIVFTKRSRINHFQFSNDFVSNLHNFLSILCKRSHIFNHKSLQYRKFAHFPLNLRALEDNKSIPKKTSCTSLSQTWKFTPITRSVKKRKRWSDQEIERTLAVLLFRHRSMLFWSPENPRVSNQISWKFQHN